jgi:hypothetical protein
MAEKPKWSQYPRPGLVPLDRNQVLWMGRHILRMVKELKARQMTIRDLPAVPLQDADLIGGRALLLVSSRKRLSAELTWLRQNAARITNHGLYPYVLASDTKSFDRFNELFQELNFISKQREIVPLTYTLKYGQPIPEEVANTLVQWPSGPKWNPALKIKGEHLKPEEIVFFRRAFGDCTSIELRKLGGGFSGNTFYVSAVINEPFIRRPLPFFAKIDTIDKILKERQNYLNYVHPSIPFNLRPNVDPTRCIFGYRRGMLVGNFVENAEDFLAVAKRDVSRSVLSSLFDRALRGWRGQAYESTSGMINGNVAKHLSQVLRWEVPKAARVRLAHRLGAKSSFKELRRRLFALPEKSFRVALSHGDLYANNIQVLGTEAVLIDFASVTLQTSLMADPAYLELTLVFKDYGVQDDPRDWKRFVDAAYEAHNFIAAPAAAIDPRPREWLWNVVRQIRLIALGCQSSLREYQTAIAFMLLRESAWNPPNDTRKQRHRRAYAYVIAERLVRDLEKNI